MPYNTLCKAMFVLLEERRKRGFLFSFTVCFFLEKEIVVFYALAADVVEEKGRGKRFLLLKMR